MNLSHDLYAETNPAFCTFVLAEFVRSYELVNSAGPELPIVYLALPVALSSDLGTTFDGTNKNTGLLEWLERSPQVQVGLAKRVNASLEIVTEAMRFSCFVKAIRLTEDARLLGARKLKKSALIVLDNESAQSVNRAHRLGYWCAMAGSTRNIFDIFGLSA